MSDFTGVGWRGRYYRLRPSGGLIGQRAGPLRGARPAFVFRKARVNDMARVRHEVLGATLKYIS